MDGNGKKKNQKKKKSKNLRFGKKNLSSSKTGESVGNAKQTTPAPVRSTHLTVNLSLINACGCKADAF